MFKYIRVLSIVILTHNLAFADEACLETRYSFDVGSGAIKSTGNLVDKCQGKIIKRIGERNVHLKFEQCMVHTDSGAHIDKSCFDKTKQAIEEIENHYKIDCKTSKCAGVATEWARKAKNSQVIMDIFKEKGIYVKLLDQKQEGQLGFFTAESHHKGIATPNDKQVVLDVGGGSFQIAIMGNDSQVHVINGRYGVESMYKEVVQKYNITKPYLSAPQFEQVVSDYTKDFTKLFAQNKEVSKKLSEKHLVTFGIGRPMAVAMLEQVKLPQIVTQDDLRKISLEMSVMTEEEVQKKYPLLPQHYIRYVQGSFVLILSIMKAAGIESIQILNSKASDYVALDPEFWW
ncbi:MAG: hypothetical protein ACHP6I_02360 [Rickettsiales bacterium]